MLDRRAEPNKITLGLISPVRRPVGGPGYLHLASETHKYKSIFGEGAAVDLNQYRRLIAETDNRYAVHEITDTMAVIVTASE